MVSEAHTDPPRTAGGGRRQPAAGPPRRRRLGAVAGRAGHRAAAGDGEPRGRVGRLGRRHEGDASHAARRGHPAAARQAFRGPAPRLLPRVRQRDPVAAAARRDRETALRARLVAELPARQRRLRRPGAGRARRAARRARLGPRLPPHARPAADQGAAARSAGRVLPARALAVAGHLRPPALAAGDPARAARRRRGVLPHRGLPRELRPGVRPLPGRHRRPGGRLGDQAAGPAGGVDDERADLHRRGRVQPRGPRPGDRPRNPGPPAAVRGPDAAARR